MQVIIEFALYEIVYKLIHGDGILSQRHILRAQFHLRLTLESRFLHVDGNGSHYAVSDIAQLHVFLEKLLYRLAESLSVGSLMGAAEGGMLAVDKRVILLAGLIRVRKRNLDILALQMNDRIKRLSGHVLPQEVHQTVFGMKLHPVVFDGEAGIEVGVIAQERLDILASELIILKKALAGIGLELDIRTSSRALCIGDNAGVAHQMALMKLRTTCHAIVAKRLHYKMLRKRIHRLRTHTVQTHGFLKRFCVVFTAGIED